MKSGVIRIILPLAPWTIISCVSGKSSRWTPATHVCAGQQWRGQDQLVQGGETFMARLRLQTQLLISSLLIICALTGAILLIVRHTIRSQIAEQVRDSTHPSLREFESVQQQLRLQLSRPAALLAELPTLKALMTTQHAPTIQDASIPFWK